MQTDFERLYSAFQGETLLLAYDRFLRDLFARPFWDAGSVANRRVAWSLGRQARKEDPTSFNSPGMYIWGFKDQPLYIGITGGTFGRRFNRYIWSKQSQCNLAKEYAPKLIANEGFPSDVLQWYARQYSGEARLKGATRFAQVGIDSIWFTLLPHRDSGEIKALEAALVTVAEKWNEINGRGGLLNVEFNHKRQAVSSHSRAKKVRAHYRKDS